MITSEQIKFRNGQLIYNLRFRWKKELEAYSNDELVTIYNEFAISDWYGNNDERFLEFVSCCHR